MNLYICGSNRNKNCYKVLNDLKNENDKLITLANKNIKYCLGCSSCLNELNGYCIQKDDMQEIYKSILEADKIIIASPIYMNHISGILKNVIDRFNPFSYHGNLKGKKVYLIAIGQMDEEENKQIVNILNEYFIGISDFMEFEFDFVGYLSSGNIELIDDVSKNNEDYEKIIIEMKNKIK